jgi:hypothetical protein
MSNGQMQTRGLSAADWTRLKRLNGAKNYKDVNLDTNKDINPPTQPQLPYGLPIHVYRVGGSSKIRRPASDWIAYRASQTADYPTPSGRVVSEVEPGTVQVMTRLCNCSNAPLETKVAGCISCQYNPVENTTFEFDYGITYDIDFSGETQPGNSDSIFVLLTLNTPTTRVSFRYLNVPPYSGMRLTGNWSPEINSDANISESLLFINNVNTEVSTIEPYFYSYGIYPDNDTPVVSNDIVTVIFSTPVSGEIAVGIY